MITLAKDGMRTDLERIWRLCFGDTPEYISYFFDNRYNPNACAVYVDETVGRPVAMLHMLDCSITEDSEISPAQYIYAAATRPDYQKRGIMTRLIEFAKRYAKAKGQRYIVLVPGTRELFKYYEKNGFYRCFKVRNVCMTRNDLMLLSGFKQKKAGMADQSAYKLMLNDVFAVRRDILIDREGFLSWDYKAFRYAAGLHEKTGGVIITAAKGADAGYAFCSMKDDKTLSVTEFIASSGFDEQVIINMLDAFGCDDFEFRLPVYNEFFSRFGEVVDYGMITSVSGRSPINLLTLKDKHSPYLGLALD